MWLRGELFVSIHRFITIISETLTYDPVFRDQELDIHGQLDLARHFGPLHKHATTPIPRIGLEEVHGTVIVYILSRCDTYLHVFIQWYITIHLADLIPAHFQNWNYGIQMYFDFFFRSSLPPDRPCDIGVLRTPTA